MQIDDKNLKISRAFFNEKKNTWEKSRYDNHLSNISQTLQNWKSLKWFFLILKQIQCVLRIIKFITTTKLSQIKSLSLNFILVCRQKKWKTNPIFDRFNSKENVLCTKNIAKYISKFKSILLILDQEDFTSESIELVKTTILGSSFKAMVTGYHYDNTPFIQLSRRHDFVSKITWFKIWKILFSNVWWILIYKKWSIINNKHQFQTIQH